MHIVLAVFLNIYATFHKMRKKTLITFSYRLSCIWMLRMVNVMVQVQRLSMKRRIPHFATHHFHDTQFT